MSMAQDLGLRMFSRYMVQRKILSNQIQTLEQRYHEYLQLLAADSEVSQGLKAREPHRKGKSPRGLTWLVSPTPPFLQSPYLASCLQVTPRCLPRQHWEALGPPGLPHEQPWPLQVLVELGKQLAEMLVKAIHMPSYLVTATRTSKKSIPVLYHAYSFRSFRQVCCGCRGGAGLSGVGVGVSPRGAELLT